MLSFFLPLFMQISHSSDLLSSLASTSPRKSLPASQDPEQISEKLTQLIQDNMAGEFAEVEISGGGGGD
jgi:hypothetical protein